MADAPRTWAILLALQTRLQTIKIADGYRTDAGADVRLEESAFEPSAAPRITLYTGSTVRPNDARVRGEREFTLVVEAAVSTEMETPQQQVIAMAEDIEEALDGFLQQPAALQLAFDECVFLQRPDGVPAMVAQLMFSTRYRR